MEVNQMTTDVTNIDALMSDLGSLSSWDIAQVSFGFDKKRLKPHEDLESYTVYHYRTPKELEVKEGDFVVVMSSSGLGIGYVVGVLENKFENASKANEATAWVITPVDLSTHQLRVEAEEKKEYIKTQLEEERRKYEDIAVYKMMAKDNPKAKALLDSLAKLQGTVLGEGTDES